ncbi:MAG: hypothetical protein ACE5I3_01095 [Phycisphaerae bacterium]
MLCQLSYARNIVANCSSASRSIATIRIYDRSRRDSVGHSLGVFVAPDRTISRRSAPQLLGIWLGVLLGANRA